MNEAYLDRLKALQRVPILRSLPKDYHPLIAGACKTETFDVGETVVRQGDAGTKMFLIKAGEAAVFVGNPEPKQVATMRAGDYFGEQAVLFNTPRAATVTATTELTCLSLSRAAFQELGLHKRLHFRKRQAITEVATPPARRRTPPIETKKSPETMAFIVRSIMRNKNLAAMNLTEARAAELAKTAWLEEIQAGHDVIKQGAVDADVFYVVSSGAFDVFKERASSYQKEQKVATIDPGSSFGELALMYSAKRAATVRATRRSELWAMNRSAFKLTMMCPHEKRVNSLVDLLEHIPLFDSFWGFEKQAVIRVSTPVTFSKDDLVIEQGSHGMTFYILYEGEVAVVKDGVQVKTLAASRLAQTVFTFGERALLKEEPRAATVKVISPVASALMLDKATFTEAVGSMRDRQSVTSSSLKWKERSTPWKPKLADLKMLGVLGRGGFGKVELREDTKKNQYYAVKILSKDFIVMKGMQNSLVNEVHVMASLNSPFIIELFATNKDRKSIYLFMEPALGGELWEVYQQRGFHGSHEHATYYAASVALALEHMHHHHVVYRDLKPENLMLHESGGLKITDMGLAKFTTGRLYTAVGTPEYFSPELIRYAGQTCAVDWWALGVLIFELMTGTTPFAAEDEEKMLSNILEGVRKVQFPKSCEQQQSTESIVTELLQDDPSERLPMRHGGLCNLKEHPWFSRIDWSALEALALTPPYVPSPREIVPEKKFPQTCMNIPNLCSTVLYSQKQPKDDGSGWDADF